MYNAYATDDDGPRGYGTTNLHSDMADAVNIMMFAGKRPADLIDHGPDIGGALWNIYPSEHGNLLREFLQKYLEILRLFFI
jgi:hypothetical protein